MASSQLKIKYYSKNITKGLVPWLIVLVLCLLVFILFPNLITYPISILFPA